MQELFVHFHWIPLLNMVLLVFLCALFFWRMSKK